MIAIILIGAALLLAAVALIQAQGKDLTAWAVVLLAVALLIPTLQAL